MKRIITLVIFVFTLIQGYSQTKGISYQAVILNPNEQQIPGENAQGNILSNSLVVIQFTIIDASSNEEYQEYHATTTDKYGMINLLIGSGTPTSINNFSDIVWDGNLKKLQVAIDFSGSGSNYTPLSEQNLSYMPQPVPEETNQLITDNVASILTEQDRATAAEQANTTDIATNATAILLKEDKANKSVNVVTDGASDVKYPSVKAIKTYVDASIITGSPATATNTTNISTNTTNIATNTTDIAANASDIAANTANIATNAAAVLLKEDKANKSINVVTDGASDVKYPSVKAIKTYVDASIITGSPATATNTTNISTNTTNIATNATDIATNASDIATNASDIAANTTDIATNAAAVSLKEDKANKSVNVVTDGASDVKYPSVKAIKTYVDASIITGSPATATNTTNISTNATDIATLQTEQTTQNAAIALNTAKVTNATHTGDVTGATVLTIGDGKVTDAKIVAVAASKLTGTVAIANGGTGATTKAAGFDALSPMTVVGDIMYGGVSGTGTVLSKGTANQVLTMNAAATAPEWKTPAAGATDINGLTDGKTILNSVFLGSGAGSSITSTTAYNTGIGVDALKTNISGLLNTAIGYNALKLNTSSSNTAIGTYSLDANTTGNSNTGLGYNTLSSNITGTLNTAIGSAALDANTTGSWNVSIGSSAHTFSVAGEKNVIIGAFAGYGAYGSSNVFLGYKSGYNEVGSNKLYIANSETTTPLIYGDFGAKLVTINGNFKLRASNPSTGGSLSFYEATSSGTAEIIIQAPATLTGTYGMLLPDSAGAKGQVLRLSNNLGYLEWNDPDRKMIIAIPSVNYTLSATSDTYIICEVTGASVTLPSAVGIKGKEFIIKNMTATNVVITTTGTEQIWQDATTKTTSATLGIESNNNWIKVVSDGIKWISFRALY